MKNIKHKIGNFNNTIIDLLNKFFKSNKHKYKKLTKNFNNTIIDFFNKVFKFNKYKYKQLTKISNFNKGLIFLIGSLFLYLFYLSIPSLYDKGRLQKDISNKLKDEFKINFSISSEINYSILPSPHIFVKNVKIFDNDLKTPKEVVQIKDLKIFISQKNLINQDKLKIKKIFINNANFLIKNQNINFYNTFINNKLSHKKIIIKNSNIFYKDKNNEIISIFSISDLFLYFDQKKLTNQIILKGNIFTIPFNLKWNRNFDGEIKKETLLELKKINFKIKNYSTFKNEKYLANSELIIGSKKLIFNFQIDDQMIIFVSNNSKLINDDIRYNGSISLDPFSLRLDIDLEKMNFNDFLKFSPLFHEFLKTNLLFNKNLSSEISVNSKKIFDNKLFDSSKVFINFNNGKINLNNSYLKNNKIGVINLGNSSIESINNELVFIGDFNFNIDNQSSFYRSFQIAKKNRIPVKNIHFNLEYNMFKDELSIISFKINNSKKLENENFKIFLENFNKEKSNKINNWIDLKNLVNKIFISYAG